MRILVTSIGSMAAECVIRQLKNGGHTVVGCDIYPGEWHAQTKLCDQFHQAPLATDEGAYINFLLHICHKESLSHVVPLTDLEIDVINRHRGSFENNNLVLCTQPKHVVEVVRNKHLLYMAFKDDERVPSIRTYLLTEVDPATLEYPCLAKPLSGRSSEGIIRNATLEQVIAIRDKGNYLVQEQLSGEIFTVDYCRSNEFEIDCAIPRKELLRTANGAGLTVQMSENPSLIELTCYIGRKLGVNGCVNMEFIAHNGLYYLIDINPRFSAGVAFSILSSYDMVSNHINCFTASPIMPQPAAIEERVLIKKYQEVM